MASIVNNDDNRRSESGDWKSEEVPVGQIDSILNYGEVSDLPPVLSSPTPNERKSDNQKQQTSNTDSETTPNPADTPESNMNTVKSSKSSGSSSRSSASALDNIIHTLAKKSDSSAAKNQSLNQSGGENVKPRSKLNPKAAQYQAHGSGFHHGNLNGNSVNSVPNLNTASVHSNSFKGGAFPSQALRGDKMAGVYERRTNLEMSQQSRFDEIACSGVQYGNSVNNSPELSDLLKQYILKKCTLNAHCNSGDFDGTALEGLTRLSFVQSLQAVEHYAASVSERILKKPAYLMGIIRGQESHWENSRAAAHLEGGCLQLLHLPKRLLTQIGHCCLQGNCLPSDFTPEVLLSLHSLTVEFAMKAVNAFDSNKRIVAGCRGGVVNRPRFLQRLIENVIQQNPIILGVPVNGKPMVSKEKQQGPEKVSEDTSKDQTDTADSKFSSPKSFLSLLGSGNSGNVTGQSQNSPNATSNSNSSRDRQLTVDEKLKFLERELTGRIERERRLRQELGNLKVQVSYWEKECHRLNTTITHILYNQRR